jgi:hypothetical protein
VVMWLVADDPNVLGPQRSRYRALLLELGRPPWAADEDTAAA